jgi:hypothetical protein
LPSFAFFAFFAVQSVVHPGAAAVEDLMVRFTLAEVFVYWVLGFGAFSLCTRKAVARVARKTRLPRIVSYYLILTPVILIEEALTIEVPYFWGILPMVAVFYIMFLPLYLVQRYGRCSFMLVSLLFGAWGVFNEFILVGRIYALGDLPRPVLLVLCVLCFLIYAVMAVWPSYYLQTSLKEPPPHTQLAGGYSER